MLDCTHRRVYNIFIMAEKGIPQKFGRTGEELVATLLSRYGCKVSRARKRQGINAEPFDLLVDGKPIEVKTSHPHLPAKRPGLVFWRFNIHRHAILSEDKIFAYVLRFENFPGCNCGLYMFFRSPLERKVLTITLAAILKRPEYYNAVQDFYKFAKGEFTRKKS